MVKQALPEGAGKDPYDMSQEDPAKSNAQNSSLWEIKVFIYNILNRYIIIIFN